MDKLFWFINSALFALAGFQFSQGEITAGIANILIAVGLYGLRESYK